MDFVVLICAYLLLQVSADSCIGRCGNSYDASKPCQCNSHCIRHGDCCTDYTSVCVFDSCIGRCGNSHDVSKTCQCNSYCTRHGDCCTDYTTVCVSGGGECDVSCLADLLWANDVNRVQVHVNLQGHTTTTSSSDVAAQPLFSPVHNQVFQKPTFRTFLALLDNYNPNTADTESLTDSQWREIDEFMDAILQTPVMTLLYNFLRNESKVSDNTSFRATLNELWFNLYARFRRGPLNSSGFEHVLVGEIKGSKVSGFHSWIQFYLEEMLGHVNYQGWVSRHQPLSILSVRFTWNGKKKSRTSFFLGSSPEFDLALYTVCAVMKPNSSCLVRMAGQTVRIQTYDVASKRGLQVATAYPNI